MSNSDRPLAVFDLDDTLNHLSRAVYASMCRRGLDVPVEAWTTYDWSVLYRRPTLELMQMLISDELLRKAQPNEEAIAAVRELAADGVEIEIWTARRWFPRGMDVTKEYLKYHGCPFDAIRLSHLRQSKSELLQPDRAPVLFVDDSASHVAAVKQKSPDTEALLVSKPWNRSSDLPKVSCASVACAEYLASRRAAPILEM